MQDLSQPLISIIVPTYNTAAYLPQCLESVIDQTYDHWELIAIDDGSTDESPEILARYAAQDGRIRVLEIQPRRGPGSVRNRGIEAARGEYLLFLDSDDFVDEHLFECAVKRAEETDADIVIWDVWYFNDRLKRAQHPPVGTLTFGNFDTIRPVFQWRDNPDQLFQSFQNWAWNKMFKASFIREHDIRFHEDIIRTEDLQFVGAAMIHAERMAVMGQRLTYYRIHRESSAMATKDSRPLDFLTAFWDFKSYLQDQGLYEELRVSFVNWALSSSFYNLYTMKTLDGYLQVFHAIKEGGLESLGADEISPDQYHDWGVRADVEALRSSSDLQFMYRWIRIVDDAKEDAVAWIDFISMDRESELASLNHRLGTVEEELAVSREEARQLQEEVKRLQDNLTVANELLDQADRRLNATEQKVGQAICYVPRLIQRAVIARSNARPSDGNEV